MNAKHVFLMITAGAMATISSPVSAETSTVNKLTFACELGNGGVPSTVLQAEGTTQSIFSWNSEQLAADTDVLELCKDVANKLTDYSTESDNLSVLAFKSDVQGGVPMICATSDSSACEKTLLTVPLSRTQEAAVVAKNVLSDILSPDLKTKETVENRRGLQSITHSISLAELIFGRKFIKSF